MKREFHPQLLNRSMQGMCRAARKEEEQEKKLAELVTLVIFEKGGKWYVNIMSSL